MTTAATTGNSEVDHWIEQNRDLLTNPYEVNALLKGAQDSLSKMQEKMAKWRSDPFIAQVVDAPTPMENAKSQSGEPALGANAALSGYSNPTGQIDYFTRMTDYLGKLAEGFRSAQLEAEKNPDSLSQYAQETFIRQHQEALPKAGTTLDRSMYEGEWYHQMRDKAEKALKEKPDDPYWSKILSLSTENGDAIRARAKERYEWLMQKENNASFGLTGDELVNEFESGKDTDRYLMYALFGLGGLAVFVLAKKYFG